MGQVRVYSVSDVVAMGFEASCRTHDGTLYFWHGRYGVRIDRRTGQAKLLTDPADLPEGTWTATALGAKELTLAGSARRKAATE